MMTKSAAFILEQIFLLFTHMCRGAHHKLNYPLLRTLAFIWREEELHRLLHGRELRPRAISSTASTVAPAYTSALHEFTLSVICRHDQLCGSGRGRTGG